MTKEFIIEVTNQVINLAKNGTIKEKIMSDQLLNSPLKMAKFIKITYGELIGA